MATRTIDVAELKAQVAVIFRRLDVPSQDAEIVADHLVEATRGGSTPTA